MNCIDHSWKDIDGWFAEDEAEALRDAYRDRRQNGGGGPLTIVELGSYKGRSTAILAQCCKESGGIVYAVDRWVWCKNPTLETVAQFNPAAPDDQRQDYMAEFVQNMHDLRLIKQVIMWRLDTLGAAVMFGDESVDLILHDASHDYESARADLNAWIPKLRKGGILCMHDYGWDDGQGCGRAVNERSELEPLRVVHDLYMGRKR